jgi:putative transposase
MGQLLEVSRSGYDEWRSRPPRPPADAEQEVQDKIQRYFSQGRGIYGPRRIKHLLAQDGLRVSRWRIGRVLAQAGLRCKTQRKLKPPRSAEQAQTIAPNQLNRELTVQVPDTIYLGDIPSLPTGECGLSLAVVLELCSRAVVGWIMHTDHGSQDEADSYRQLLTQDAIQPSMSRKGHG